MALSKKEELFKDLWDLVDYTSGYDDIQRLAKMLVDLLEDKKELIEIKLHNYICWELKQPTYKDTELLPPHKFRYDPEGILSDCRFLARVLE
jgi:hypothetical protein